MYVDQKFWQLTGEYQQMLAYATHRWILANARICMRISESHRCAIVKELRLNEKDQKYRSTMMKRLTTKSMIKKRVDFPLQEFSFTIIA